MSLILGLFDRLFAAAQGLPGFRRDQRRKAVLREMLEDETYEWRSLGMLARSIGASEEKTKDLLISIGARASTIGDEKWALTSRVGKAGTRRG